MLSFLTNSGTRTLQVINKYLILKDYISEPSDDEGIAKFTNLTVIGSSELLGYIHFFCEGVTTVWTDRLVSNSYGNVLPPRAFYPIPVETNEIFINILTDIHRTVQEGKIFDLPLTIQVLDSRTGNPQPNVVWFAHLHKDRNDTIPLGYRFGYSNHPVKHIERPIAGKYADNFDNPSYPGELIQEYDVTDADGKLTFKDLRLSQSGQAGNYTISFSWGFGTTVMEHPITVRTSIDKSKIKFRTKIPTDVYAKDLAQTEYDLIFVIEVLDMNDVPVKGKYPNKIYVETNLTKQSDNIEVKIQHELDVFEASLDDGIMTIPVKISKLSSSYTVANITLEIDGLNITTPYITFINFRGINLNTFSQLKLTSVPSVQFENGMKIGDKFEIKAKAYDQKGDEFNLEGLNLYLGVFTNPVSQAPIPLDFVKLDAYSPSQIRKSKSEITFKDCSFTRAGAGHYYLGIFAYDVSILHPDFNFADYYYASEMVRVYVNQLIDVVFLISASNDTLIDKPLEYLPPKDTFMPLKAMVDVNSDDEYGLIEMDRDYILGFMLYSYEKGPLVNIDVQVPNLIFEEFPVLMSAEENGPNDYVSIKSVSSKTDANGTYFVRFRIEYGGIGGYVVSLDFGSCISIPNALKTENTLKSIKIETEPDFYVKSFVNEGQNSSYTGRLFDLKARVRIDVTKGSKRNYIIIAHPKAVTPNSTFSLDILPQSDYELNSNKENYIGWVSTIEGARYAKTNAAGEAVFTDLTVWDITGDNATWKLYFAAGDHLENMYLVTNVTENNYTFIPSYKFEIESEPSKFISAYQSITPSPIIKVTSYVPRHFLIMNMQFSYIFNNYIKDSYMADLTTRYTTGGLWFALLTDKVDFSSGCQITFLTDSSKSPSQFLLTMTSLKWTVFGIESKLQMSFSTLLQHNTSQSGITETIELENTAKLITFLKDPPLFASVNEIFQIKVLVSINGGSPLPNAKVSCNVTKAVSYSTLSSEIFTALANSNYNVQKSSLLAPKAKLDPSRTVGKTDKHGISKLYLRIKEAPLGGSVRLVCQSGAEVTSPSTAIRVTHPVQSISFEQNHTEPSKISFNKSIKGAYLTSQATIKVNITLHLNMSHDTDLLRADDITLDLIPYDEVISIREYSNIDPSEIADSINNVTSIKSAFESLYDLGVTLMRGIQTVNTIKSNQKKTYKTEFNATIVGQSVKIQDKIIIYVDKPQKYMLSFGLNGVYTDILTQDAIVDVQEKTNALKRVFDLYDILILTVFYLIILIFASKMVKGYFMLVALLLTGGYVYLIHYKKGTTMLYTVLVYLFAGLIGIYLLWAFLTYFIDGWIRKRAPSYYYIKKKKFYMEYVYQRLNGHPSNFWVSFFYD